MSLNAPFFEQESRRETSLVTPVTFDVDIGAGTATVYTGIADQAFLIRAMAVINDTLGSITITVNVGGNPWFQESRGTLTVSRISELEGMLIAPSTNITATGENLRLVGWGLRVQGGSDWVL